MDRQLFHSYEKVRSIVQSVSDFIGDRLRVSNQLFKQTLFDSIRIDGMAGLIKAVSEYARNTSIATLSKREDSDNHTDNHFSYYDIPPKDMNIKYHVSKRSVYYELNMLMGCCRRLLRRIRHSLQRRSDQVSFEDSKQRDEITNSKPIESKVPASVVTQLGVPIIESGCDMNDLMTQLDHQREILIYAARRDYHINSHNKIHMEVLLMYLSVSSRFDGK